MLLGQAVYSPGCESAVAGSRSSRLACLLQRQEAIPQPLAPGFAILKPVLHDDDTSIATPIQECSERR